MPAAGSSSVQQVPALSSRLVRFGNRRKRQGSNGSGGATGGNIDVALRSLIKVSEAMYPLREDR